LFFLKFDNIGTDDEVMDMVEEERCENNDVVDAVEDQCRSQGNCFCKNLKFLDIKFILLEIVGDEVTLKS